MDIVQAIDEGRALVEWAVLASTHGPYVLTMGVMRDALKIDGIRCPATAVQMQLVADRLGAMLPTPKLLDLIWLEAGKTGVRFDPVINYNGVIVANMRTEDVSRLVDEKVAKAGDNGGIIASVGKYWVLTNKLLSGKFGSAQACNYGWHARVAPYSAVTPSLKVWQSIGSRHNNQHVDPSQVIRLISRSAMISKGGAPGSYIDVHAVATDPELAPLISHEGALKTLRQPGAPKPKLPV